MRCLNLYAGIGGNRKLWPDDCRVTAVEIRPDIAKVYHSLFPQDTVLVEDAHDYLLHHYQEFDFIWSSPPCPSHSKIRHFLGVKSGQNSPIYPEMSLYQEIIFLQHYAQVPWVVENVIPYYKFLIQPAVILGRHAFWSNYWIPRRNFFSPSLYGKNKHNKTTPKDKKELLQTLGLSTLESKVGLTAVKNCVNPEISFFIFEQQFQQQDDWIQDHVLTSQPGIKEIDGI